jgi:hypothetical protein
MHGDMQMHVMVLGKKSRPFLNNSTSSLSVAYTDEAIKEVNLFFQSKKGYVGTDGNFIYDNNTDTIRYVLENMTG